MKKEGLIPSFFCYQSLLNGLIVILSVRCLITSSMAISNVETP